MLLTLLALLTLLGLSLLSHGSLALVRNARAVSASPSTEKRWFLCLASVIGVVLAVSTLFVCYPCGETGRICGFPFPAATPNASALDWRWRDILPEVDERTLGVVAPTRYPMQLANMAVALLIPQFVLWLILRNATAASR